MPKHDWGLRLQISMTFPIVPIQPFATMIVLHDIYSLISSCFINTLQIVSVNCTLRFQQTQEIRIKTKPYNKFQTCKAD